MIERTADIIRVQNIDKSGVKPQSSLKHEATKTDKNRMDNIFDANGKDEKKIGLKEAVSKMNKALEIFNVERRFVIDDRTHEVVVKIIDKETGKVIDQIPPEEALKRYYEMQRFIGLLFNKRV